MKHFRSIAASTYSIVVFWVERDCGNQAATLPSEQVLLASFVIEPSLVTNFINASNTKQLVASCNFN